MAPDILRYRTRSGNLRTHEASPGVYVRRTEGNHRGISPRVLQWRRRRSCRDTACGGHNGECETKGRHRRIPYADRYQSPDSVDRVSSPCDEVSRVLRQHRRIDDHTELWYQDLLDRRGSISRTRWISTDAKTRITRPPRRNHHPECS